MCESSSTSPIIQLRNNDKNTGLTIRPVFFCRTITSNIFVAFHPYRYYLYGMLSYGQAFYQLKNELHTLYDERESAAIAHEVLEYITGLDKTQRLIQKEETLTAAQQGQFDGIKKELLAGRPLQYITHTAWFMGRPFKVNEHVLIPRPETEELVQWVVDDNKNHAPEILDIGTGSGCIPISLKLAISAASVTTCDISKGALETAKENAAALGAGVHFSELNFLDVATHSTLGNYDIIVSNPPYIPASKKETMHINVVNYEPAIALFVPDDNALIFYRAIALFGKDHLNQDGAIYCETEADLAQECQQIFEATGYAEVTVRKDMHGNWRMLKALKK